MAVKTYYYLWALYFVYFTEIGEGWDHYRRRANSRPPNKLLSAVDDTDGGCVE